MFYKPKFCVECGEKIERAEWKLWTSRRFCDLCEKDHTGSEWIPRLIFGVGIIAGIFGLGTSLQKAEKPLNIVRAAQAEELKNSVSENRSSQQPPLVNYERPPAPGTQEAVNKQPQAPPAPQNPPHEDVFYCGAATKKGTPCKRLVRGGGRCWQHLGKPAIVPGSGLKAEK